MDPYQLAKITVKNHVEGTESNNNKIAAAVGLLNENSANLIILATTQFKERIAGVTKDLGDTFQKQVDKTIESNKKLARSNNISSMVMAALTFALVAIGFWQGYLAWSTLKFQQEQGQEQNYKNEIRDNCIRNGRTNCP